jgi:thiamine pyrophosphokinase
VTGQSEGLRWPIAGLRFAPDQMIGTSNETIGPVQLTMDRPGLLVILPIETLEQVKQALVSAPCWPRVRA